MKDRETFFSYSRDDSEFVLKLASELRAKGMGLWLDQLDIVGGERWDSAVENALKSCQTMVVVLSPISIESENVMDEVSFALESGKKVVPVLAAACDIPFRLRRLHHISLAEDYDRGFEQLLRALGGGAESATVPPPSDPAPVEIEPSADPGLWSPGGLSRKRLAGGLAAVAVVAVASILTFQFVGKAGDDVAPTGVDVAIGTKAPTGTEAPTGLDTAAKLEGQTRRESAQTAATDLSFHADRFTAKVSWKTRAGQTGSGRAIPFNDFSGDFYFFDPGQRDILVKVLDGCAINGHFRVQVTGVTEVEWKLQIEDAKSGRTWTAIHPGGPPSPREQELEAFPCTVPAKACGTPVDPGPASALVAKHLRRWPDGVIPYEVDPELSRTVRRQVAKALDEWQTKTVLRFVLRKDQSDFAFFRGGPGCSSTMARVGGRQPVNVEGCKTTGEIIHQIGHLVGLLHMEQRADRDACVKIFSENIAPGMEGNFAKMTAGELIGPYSYNSIMHLSSRAFSKNGQPTIKTVDGALTTRRNDLSPGDVAAVNLIYGKG